MSPAASRPDWRLCPASGVAVPVSEPGLVCGSWTQSDLILPPGEHAAPLLAYVRCIDGDLTVRRACSNGRVAVNGAELALRQEQLLQEGDRLTLGQADYLVACGPDQPPVNEPAPQQAAASDPFADLLVPGLVPVGGAMPAPPDRHPFDRPAAPGAPPVVHGELAAQHWQPELGRAPEWVSTLPAGDPDQDLLAGVRLN